MTQQETTLVSKVMMPERGLFMVLVDESLVFSGEVAPGTKGRFVVALDYGEDVGNVVATEAYDPKVHGERMPSYRLLRRLSDEDAKTISDNEKLAAAMCNSFLSAMKDVAASIRIRSVRLSFGRTRLFIRYASDLPRIDFSAANSFLKKQFNVEANIWAMGPRDEVAGLGGLGPCGRVCCCCSWQMRYPSRLTPERRTPAPMLMNGTCGRFKCCLAFERESCDCVTPD